MSQVFYSSYACAANAVTWRKRFHLNEARPGIPVSRTCVIELSGQVQAATVALLAAASLAMEIAFQTPGQDLVLRYSDGSEMDALRNGPSLSGVRCVDGPHFTGDTPGDFTTYRQFSAAFEAEYPLVAGQPAVIDWTQTVEMSGGGPIIVWQPAINGPPMKLITSPSTTYKATQSGAATGLVGYPAYPPFLFSASDLAEKPSRKTTSPVREGRVLRTYRIEWSYRFESIDPLDSLPGLPP